MILISIVCFVLTTVCVFSQSVKIKPTQQKNILPTGLKMVYIGMSYSDVVNSFPSEKLVLQEDFIEIISPTDRIERAVLKFIYSESKKNLLLSELAVVFSDDVDVRRYSHNLFKSNEILETEGCVCNIKWNVYEKKAERIISCFYQNSIHYLYLNDAFSDYILSRL